MQIQELCEEVVIVKFKVAKTEAPKKMNPKEMLEEKRSYGDRIQKELEDKGVKFFTPVEDGGNLNIDSDYLTLPMNITEVSARDLGEYLNAFTQQKMYMRTLVGYAELFAEESKREYFTASEGRYKELLGSKLSETAKEREVNSDPNVRPYYEKYLDYKNKVKLLNFNIQSIEEAIFMLSREVSRRTGDYENERRDYNVQRK